MSGNDTSWSLGVLVWLPILLLLFGTLVAGGFLFRGIDKRMDAHNYDKGVPRLIGYGCWIVAIVLLLGTAWGMYPYSAEYHQWRPVDGTVAQIDNRLIGTGDGMETKFVVTFADGLGQYGCDDTRCASVREGDYLALSCKRAWQFTGTDGYDCRFYGTKAAS